MNTAGSPAPAMLFPPANGHSLWSRLGRVLGRVLVPDARVQATPAAAPSAQPMETGPASRRTAISSSGLPQPIVVPAVVAVPAAPRRPGLPARWKESRRVVINRLG